MEQNFGDLEAISSGWRLHLRVFCSFPLSAIGGTSEGTIDDHASFLLLLWRAGMRMTGLYFYFT